MALENMHLEKQSLREKPTTILFIGTTFIIKYSST